MGREWIKEQQPLGNPVNVRNLIISGEYSVTNKGNMFFFKIVKFKSVGV